MSQLTIPTRENSPATSDVTLALSSFTSTIDDPSDTDSVFRAPKAANQPTQQTVTTRGSKRAQHQAQLSFSSVSYEVHTSLSTLTEVCPQ